MTTRTLGIVLTLALLGAAATAPADTLVHRHAIALDLGMWSQTTDARVETIPPAVTTSVAGGGFLGGLSYRYWLEESLALTVCFGARALDVETRVSINEFSTRNAVVGSLLLGLAHYWPASTRGGAVRPYLGGGVGMFRGSQDEVVSGTTVAVTSRSEQAFGSRLGIGVDFVLGRHFLTGFWTAYDLMMDFAEPIGGSRNYSGPAFSVGFGYLFGRGAPAG